MRADQIENDAAIDIARSLARGDLKVGQIDSTHSFALMVLRFNSWRELIPRWRKSSQ